MDHKIINITGCQVLASRYLCLFLPQDNNLSQGYILGTTYNAKDKPSFNGQNIHGIKFADGSTISYDADGGGLLINCTGNLTINALRECSGLTELV